ncbi:MAG: hypothetical protein VB878_06580 [Pirellulaceae bacterium]
MNRSRIISMGVLISLWVAAECLTAQVIQLPVIHQFGVSTSVLVPDRGAIHLGGVRSAREGQVSRGSLFPGRLGRNQASGREVSTSDAWAVVRIIDLKELDRMTLLAATPEEIKLLSPVAAKITSVVRHERTVSRTASTSLDQLRVERNAKTAASRNEAMRFMAKAKEMEKRGRTASAKIYYQMAYRRGDNEIRTSALAAVRRIAKTQVPREQPLRETKQ